MRIATWNINNRVGRTSFRPDAALAASDLGADLVALTEFFPQQQDTSFRASLTSRGFAHQVTSEAPASARANRVLVASRVPIERHQLDVPAIDIHLPANVVAVRVLPSDLIIVTVRVPWYVGNDAPNLIRTWEWLSAVAADHKDRPTVLMGDFNVSVTSSASRGGSHFRSILKNGWKRALSGPTYIGAGGKGSEIDHILATEQCVLENSAVVSIVGQYELAGTPSAISDHAALMCDVSVPRRMTPGST